ncbi:ferredoxin family protein [Terrarubrum flagellatum]|uniref:ferredoxin family protein n=1 Tax=Terrirubrum flagellatum TaxID=2895980 RepID=UPI00314521C3
MIELIVTERCVSCDKCVDVCPTNVFDPNLHGPPHIARQSDCQTCFMCELYCQEDALYVGPHADRPEPVDAATIVTAGLLGQYRRDSGWDEWKDIYPNEQWRMETVFRRAAEAANR